MSYCYLGTNVLKNKFDIQDVRLLSQVERDVSHLRHVQILRAGITGRFDVQHLRSIHRHLFGDVYDWAGEFRTESIFKGRSAFAEPVEIFDRLAELQVRVSEIDWPKLSRLNLIEDLSTVFAELNQIHPFREGNGRTQRLFLRQLALCVGYDLNFTSVSENSMRNLSVAAGRGDLRLMQSTVAECLHALPNDYVVPVNYDFVGSHVDFTPILLKSQSLQSSKHALSHDVELQLLQSPSGDVRDLSNWTFSSSDEGLEFS